MGETLKLTYESSVTDMHNINSSFDMGVLKVAYTKANRNGSYISKEVFERNMPSIYNCPVVCNYIREEDDFGGHDVELVCSENGDFKLINVTTPVGVIPESANYSWIMEDGKETLCIDALIWKRQEAYAKIKDNGITSESMEINVNSGHKDPSTGLYVIDDFEFTAFCLLGDNVAPCYENASLQLFSADEFKEKMNDMMQDLKDTFSLSDTSDNEDYIINSQKIMTEGGEIALEDKMALVAKYEIDIDTLDFSIEDFTIEELTEKFEALKAVEEIEVTENAEENQDFALNSNVSEEIFKALSCEMITTEWGEYERYCFVDFDIDASEIYCWDRQDWLLYGLKYTMDGDNVVIDYNSKCRKKYAIVDFDEGEQACPFSGMFEMMEDKIKASADFEEKFNVASNTITSMETELDELRQFKAAADEAVAKNERDEVFAQFEDLIGIEAFEALKENCAEYSLEDIEEKCFAIRGRQQVPAKFALENTNTRIKVDPKQSINEEEPYGGLFVKYAIG